MFPAPLAVIKHVDQPGPTFVFDLPSCQPLLPLMGPTMATFLRKHPAVVLSWCAQVSLTLGCKGLFLYTVGVLFHMGWCIRQL